MPGGIAEQRSRCHRPSSAVAQRYAGTAVAIEPNPPSFGGLVANVRENGLAQTLTPLQIAVHPSAQKVCVQPLEWHPRRGSTALTNTGMCRMEPARRGAATPAMPLAEALAPYPRIAAIKVDAEALTCEILHSGREVLERDGPLLAVGRGARGAARAARAAWLRA
jgi:FkbM family methyltransferase